MGKLPKGSGVVMQPFTNYNIGDVADYLRGEAVGILVKDFNPSDRYAYVRLSDGREIEVTQLNKIAIYLKSDTPFFRYVFRECL